MQTTTYVYRALDNIDRLESFTVTDGVTTSTTDYTFEGYNRKTEQVTVDTVLTVDKTYVYDETNWLDSVTDTVSGATITYSYDNNGNTTLKSDSSQPGQEMVFDYDVANRLVQTTQGVTPLGQYDYNASGMRVRHYGSERGDVEYYYDDGAVLEEYVAGAGGGLLAHYRYGDRLLSLDTGTETQYYHHDALGSTVNLSDGAGLTKVSYTLDPWGHIRSQLGTSVNRQIFTGQEHDENTGLIYFGARYYDPDTGRFISQDSYLGEPGTPPSLHRYLYAYSNPTVYIDPDGNVVDTIWDVANVGIGVVSLGYNLNEGNYWDAALDAVGVVVDTAAAIVPFVPGGVGTGIKVMRGADKVVDVAQAANKANDVRSAAKVTIEARDGARLAKKAEKYGGEEQRDILAKQIKNTRDKAKGKSNKAQDTALKEAKGEVDGFHKMRNEGYDLQDLEIKNKSGHGLDQVYKHKDTGEYAINEAKHGKGFGRLVKSGDGKKKVRQGSQPYNLDRLTKFRRNSRGDTSTTDDLFRQMQDGDVRSFTTTYKGKSHHEILSKDPVPNFRDPKTYREVTQ